jgi:predicted MFS family arabinose efflux permease
MPFDGLWRDREFLKLWAGQAVSQMGSRISATALPLAAALTLQATPLQMGLLSGAGAAAILIFGLFAGAWVDRVHRRPVLILADLARAAILLAVPMAASMNRLSMPVLYAVAASTGLLTVFFDAGYQSYIPSLVKRDKLLEANSKLALTESVADIGGPGLGGILVAWFTAPMAFLFDAASFLFSAFSIWRIDRPEPPPAVPEHADMRREIAEGLHASWRDPILRALMLRTGTAGIFAGVFGGLYYLFAIRELHLDAALLGIIISLGGASNLFGALVSERLVRRWGVGPVMIGAAAVTGLAIMILPLARGTVVTCAALLAFAQCFDMTWPIYMINERTLRQAITPDRLLGRVNSAMHLLFYGAMPLGALSGGAIAQSAGLRPVMLAGALGFLLSTAFLIASPLRRLRDLPSGLSSSAIAP